MATGYTITVDPGGGNAITISANAAFEYAFRKNLNPSGIVESIDYVFVIEGRIVTTPASAVAAQFFQYATQVRGYVLPVTLTVALNGSTVDQWSAANAFYGPHVTEFQSIPDDGNADSQWRYRMTVEAKMQPTQSQNNLYEFTTSFKKTTNNGRTIREIWRATGKGKTMQAALSAVQQFAPQGDGITADITQSETEASADGIWVWEAIQETNCKVKVIGGTDFEELGVPLGNPVLHQKMRKCTVIVVTGEVVGYNPNLSPPSDHLQDDGDTIVRADARETEAGQVEIKEAEKGIYRLPYQEYWMVTSPGIPTVQHSGDHNLISLGSGTFQPPAPGLIIS